MPPLRIKTIYFESEFNDPSSDPNRLPALMKTVSLSSPATRYAVPAAWQNIHAELGKDENLLAHLELDLDPELYFAPGIVVLTTLRLLSRYRDDTVWQAWPHCPEFVLRHHDHAGVGNLELHDAASRLVTWRYTLGHNPEALHLIAEFESLGKRLIAGVPADAPQAFDEDDDAVDGQDADAVAAEEPSPSSAALFRLWRFARPYRGQLLLGFLLTLAATAATLVPPYLTLPLMDNVLIPYQNGAPINTPLVTLYLSGLFGSALLAWGLGWARTYILALVSERIGADLRTTAYEHLLRLSLEYFGGKRTGDLMTRIGSETDRICVFLSLHLLDFATDVLMIAMTAAILISINPWLALVTLLPLPFIAWMIHVVRDKLRNGFEKVDRIWSQVTNVLADTIPGIRVVKAFAQEKREAARFRDANQHNLQINDRVNKVWSLFSPTVTLPDGNRLAGRVGAGHLAGIARIDHGRRADRIPRLHQPFLHAP